MTKQISDHAAAAKLIRAELKKNGIKASVRASTASMTSSVNINLTDCVAPWVMKEIKLFCSKFQYGDFDGMTDSYNYSNNRDDLPQVRFVFVHNGRSDDDRQRAYDYLRAGFAGYENAPAKYEDAANEMFGSEWVSTEVHQVLSGCMDARSVGTRFWNKPKVDSFANI